VPLHALAHIFHTKNAIKHVFAQLSGWFSIPPI
jgi:hypothetical protein